MSLHSGVIWMVTDLETIPTVMKEMPAPMKEVNLLRPIRLQRFDGDGWSDPSQNWLASPWGQADAFPTDRLQWQDSDEDGFGDVPMGAKRDDCPEVAGTSTRDVQGCIDSDGDGWSDEYGSWNAAFSIMGEEPASSWLTYMILGTVMLISQLLQ